MKSTESPTNNLSVVVPIHKFGKGFAVESFVGDISNEVKEFYICKDNGLLLEGIVFEKVAGKVLSSTRNEIRQSIVSEYFTGRLQKSKNHETSEINGNKILAQGALGS